ILSSASSFTNTGTLSIGSGRTFTVSSGDLTFGSGATFSGSGTLSLSGVIVNVNAPVTNSLTWSSSNTTVNSASTLTNGRTGAMNLTTVAFNAPIQNDGAMTVLASATGSTANASFTTGTTGTLTVQGDANSNAGSS